jgi:hypothetical protein
MTPTASKAMLDELAWRIEGLFANEELREDYHLTEDDVKELSAAYQQAARGVAPTLSRKLRDALSEEVAHFLDIERDNMRYYPEARSQVRTLERLLAWLRE